MARIALILLMPVILLAGLVGLLAYAFHAVRSPGLAWRIAVAFDQVANAAFKGSEDETISSRAGKARRQGRRWACVLCRVLDRLDPGHCDKSIEADEGKPAP